MISPTTSDHSRKGALMQRASDEEDDAGRERRATKTTRRRKYPGVTLSKGYIYIYYICIKARTNPRPCLYNK